MQQNIPILAPLLVLGFAGLVLGGLTAYEQLKQPPPRLTPQQARAAREEYKRRGQT